MSEPPSNAIFLKRSFRRVIGRMEAIGCKNLGKTSSGKKAPERKSCGNITRFAIGEAISSFFETAATKSPIAKNVNIPTRARIIM